MTTISDELGAKLIYCTPTPPDLFLAEPQPELSADRDTVRAKLHKLLGEARAVKSMPWDERTRRLTRNRAFLRVFASTIV